MALEKAERSHHDHQAEEGEGRRERERERERGHTGDDLSVLKPQRPLLMTHLLHQGHTSQSFQSSYTKWGPSIQIHELMSHSHSNITGIRYEGRRAKTGAAGFFTKMNMSSGRFRSLASVTVRSSGFQSHSVAALYGQQLESEAC